MFAQQCKVEIEIVWKARGIRSDCEWDARPAKISHYANVQFIFEWGTEFDQPTSFDHLDQLEGIMQAKTQSQAKLLRVRGGVCVMTIVVISNGICWWVFLVK